MTTPKFVASCNELWCVEHGESISLWNPSMNTHKKVADLSALRKTISYHYGLGYDCVGDDYKILKTSVHYNAVQTTELYSLRQDSWRNIQPFPFPGAYTTDITTPTSIPGVFVSGVLHWRDNVRDSIVYFNLTTEMYGEVAPPTQAAQRATDRTYIEIMVLRRKLCTYLINFNLDNFILWAMEDYGIDKSWTKLFQVGPMNDIPCSFVYFMPLYLYDNGDILFETHSDDGDDDDYYHIYLYKRETAITKEIVGHGIHDVMDQSYVYVESLVSLASN